MRLLADKEKRRIVYAHERATPEYWSRHWMERGEWRQHTDAAAGKFGTAHRLVASCTPTGGVVLEGGCGMGQIVASLHVAGYTVIGIDNAEKAVAELNSRMPELDIRNEDLTDIKTVPSGSVDTYYSGGVIEHFQFGYSDLIREAHRVLKTNGVLILTFPFMSLSRSRLIRQLPTVEEHDYNDFYQYALVVSDVIEAVSSVGFEHIRSKKRNGLKGAIERSNSKLLKWIYKAQGSTVLKKILRKTASYFLALMGYGHTVEVTFRKKY